MFLVQKVGAGLKINFVLVNHLIAEFEFIV